MSRGWALSGAGVSLLRRVIPTRVHYLWREVCEHDTVLDLGCGSSSPLQYCRTGFRVGLDVFRPSLVEAHRRGTHDAFILADISRLGFRAKSFDVVTVCDVIEHMPKEKGHQLLATAEGIARRKVIVMTPNGFLEVGGTSENPFEEHVSGWSSSEFEVLGYRVSGLQGLQACWRPGRARLVPKAVWVAIAYCVLQPLAYHFPRKAHDLLAVKALDAREA